MQSKMEEDARRRWPGLTAAAVMAALLMLATGSHPVAWAAAPAKVDATADARCKAMASDPAFKRDLPMITEKATRAARYPTQAERDKMDALQADLRDLRGLAGPANAARRAQAIQKLEELRRLNAQTWGPTSTFAVQIDVMRGLVFNMDGRPDDEEAAYRAAYAAADPFDNPKLNRAVRGMVVTQLLDRGRCAEAIAFADRTANPTEADRPPQMDPEPVLMPNLATIPWMFGVIDEIEAIGLLMRSGNWEEAAERQYVLLKGIKGSLHNNDPFVALMEFGSVATDTLIGKNDRARETAARSVARHQKGPAENIASLSLAFIDASNGHFARARKQVEWVRTPALEKLDDNTAMMAVGIYVQCAVAMEDLEGAQEIARVTLARLGPRRDPGRLTDLRMLLALLMTAGDRPEDAETLGRQAVRDAESYEKTKGEKDPWVGVVSAKVRLARILTYRGKAAEALAIMTPLRNKLAWSPGYEVYFGSAQAASGKPALAVETLRPVCKSVRENPAMRRLMSSECFSELVAALLSYSRQKKAPTAALVDEAFRSAQNVNETAAALAQARGGARDVFTGPARDAIERYEKALDVRADIDRLISLTVGEQSGAGRLDTLVRRRVEAQAEVARLEAELKRLAPRYLDLADAQPVSVAELQGGKTGGLLGPDEAVVIWMQPPGPVRGTVFAVSRKRVAYAEIAMDHKEIRAIVAGLRRQLDPCGDGVRAASCAPSAFDRKASWRLYKALLGDPKIQAVINAPEVKTLLVASSGPIATLPAGLLVTQEPKEGDDRSAESFRYNTEWLIRSKAVVTLPAVNSLRTLRSGDLRPATAAATGGLYMMADPDFAGGAKPAKGGKPAKAEKPKKGGKPDKGGRPAEVPGCAVYGALRAGGPMAAPGAGKLDRAKLCPLPGSRREADAISAIVPGSVLLSSDAREARLRDPADQQALSSAKVIAFATHGLSADADGLREPSLILSAPTAQEKGDDGLLTASEVTGLRLSAEWVLLSACNSGGPDAGDTYGMSGLTRAFLYAGARSLLVSYWRIDDAATVELVAGTLRLNSKGVGKAQALRQASLAVLMGESPAAQDGWAHPAYWAPFALVGEGR